MKTTLKRILASLMVTAMIIGMIPMQAFASGEAIVEGALLIDEGQENASASEEALNEENEESATEPVNTEETQNAEETAAAEEEDSDAEEKQTPAAEITAPTEEEAPAAGETAPAAEESAPAEETVPSAEESAPTEETVPAVEETKAPAAEEAAPVAPEEVQAAPAAEAAPAALEEASNPEEAVPTEPEETSVTVKGTRGLFYSYFDAEAAGMEISVAVSNLRASSGMTMTVETVSAGEYEAAIATANYGKVVNGIKAFRISFADKHGRAVSNIGSAYADVKVSFAGAENCVLYKVDGSASLLDQDKNGRFSFDINKKAGTYAAAGLVSDGITRASGKKSGTKTVYAAKNAGTDISVTVPKNAFTGTVLMETKEVAADSVAEAVAAALPDTAIEGVVGAFDISFASAAGAEQQPAKAVEVTIALPLDMTKNYQLVHIGDDGSASVVENAVFTESGVTFQAESFSIYAVVNHGNVEDLSRVTVNFHNGNEIVSTQIVKKNDTLVDPGIGTLSGREQFGGWYLDSALTAGPYTIEDLNNQLSSGTFEEGSTVDVYTKIVDVYKIVYKDEEGTIVKNETIAVEHDAASYTYTTDISYIPPQNNQEFRGWKYDGVDYANGQTITVAPAADIELVADIKTGYWITFDENDTPDENTNYNAVYIGPKLIAEGETFNIKTDYATSARGYVFDGWYTAATGGTRVDTVSYNQLNGNVTYYAHWSPAATAKYTVIIWMQKVTDDYRLNLVDSGKTDADRTYDYYSSTTMTGTVGRTPSVPTGDTGTGLSRTGFSYSSNDAATKTIAADGSTVVNIYYNRHVVTYAFETNTVSGYKYERKAYVSDGYVVRGYLDDEYTYYSRGSGNGGDSISKYNPRWKTSLFNLVGYTGYAYMRGNDLVSGLYGAPFPESFTWNTSREWKCDQSWWQELIGGGTTQTFLTGFSEDRDVVFKDNGGAGTTQQYKHIKQDIDGHYRESGLAFTGKGSRGGTFTITDKFAGFTHYGYTTNSLNENNINTAGSFSSNASTVYIYHKRNTYALNFIDAENNTVLAPQQVLYEDSLARFADAIPTSVPDGKYFNGWYTSPAFTDVFDFANETMDNTNGKIVVAHFADEHFRVIIHPNNGEAEPSFMSEYKEQIQPNPYTKNGYSLVGWYTDEACTKPYNLATLLTNGTEGMDTDYREEAEPSIRGKIEIYAKWRKTGTDGMVRLRYEATNGTAPVDINYYADQGDAFIASAPTSVTGDDRFLYWTFNGEKYYPGQIFVVHAADAEKATYDGVEANWITLTAVYGTPETAPTTTIIIDLQGGTLDPSYVTNLTAALNGTGAEVTQDATTGNITIARIPLNKEFTLPSLAELNSAGRGYEFDCWTTQKDAKPEDATFEAGTVVAGDLNDTATNPETNTVYALWNKYFYIYHSGDGSWEEVLASDTKERNEYTKDGYYYGGYGVIADAAASLPSELSYADGRVSGTPAFAWDWDTAEYSGNAFDKQVGDVFYLKEVENTYLPTPKVVVLKEDFGNGVISAIRIISAADTDVYYWGGAKIDGSDVDGFISKKFTMTQNGTGLSTTFQASDLGIEDGYVIVANGTVAAGEHTYEPYWYTLDEVTVYGGAEKVKNITISSDLKNLT